MFMFIVFIIFCIVGVLVLNKLFPGMSAIQTGLVGGGAVFAGLLFIIWMYAP